MRTVALMPQNLRAVARVGVITTMAALTACSRTFAPGPGVDVGSFEPIRARCSLMVRQGGGSFEVYGRPRPAAVAAAGLLFIAAEAARVRQDMDDCMAMNGWNVTQAVATGSAPPQHAGFTEIFATSRACISAVRAQPVYQSIAQHFADVETGRYSPEQLADPRIPTEAEIALLVSYRAAVDPCVDATIAAVFRLTPVNGAILADIRRLLEYELAALKRRQITWGDFANRAMKLDAERLRRIRAAQA